MRAALATVAPHRLAEMEQQKNEAIALAVETGSIAPLRGFLTTWAIHLEIARRLDTAGELVRAVAARCLDGVSHQGVGEGTRTATVEEGFLPYLVVPRHERLYILQVTGY